MPLAAISVVSASAIAYEILLMRLFSIVQWHHFAFMIISVALLGYGVSGTVIALAQGRWRGHFLSLWQASAVGFGLSSPAAFALAPRLPFNPLALAWDMGQLLYLGLMYLLLMIPFFFAATCIGLTFSRFGTFAGRIYFNDLLGAGAGAAGVIAALFTLAPAQCLRLIVVLAFGAAVLAGRNATRRRKAALLAAGVVVALLLPAPWIEPEPSEYKGLSQVLRIPGAEVAHESTDPLGRVTVVRSPRVPFRHVPGLSLTNIVEPPPQLAVFNDGDGLVTITQYAGDRNAVSYLDHTTQAAPHHLLDSPRVLILGAGGGADVILALYHRAARIDAVEVNPNLVRLVTDTFAEFAGPLFAPPDRVFHVAEGRAFLAAARTRYDLIQVPVIDPAGTGAAGTGGLGETYLYTVEALESYLRHLNPGGFVSFTGPLKLPPRNSLKLLVTAVAALERIGVSDPDRRVVLIRGWKTTTLLIKNGRLTTAEIAALREFTRDRSFDVSYYPGMPPEDANRFNLLDRPSFFEGAQAILGPGREDFIARYKFDLRPATDDRPYFFDFFRWRSLPEFLALRRQGNLAPTEWGYVILAGTLAQATVLSLLLIMLPFRALRRLRRSAQNRYRVALYFLALGLAFFFIEIAFIQRLVLFLGHPLYAVAVVLAAFLVFAGLGAGLSKRLASIMVRSSWRLPPIQTAVAAIAVLVPIEFILQPAIFEVLAGMPAAVKVPAALLTIAPLAFAMGMPFPLGLRAVDANAPELVPWAWGINGCASVISVVLATLLAMQIGFSGVVLMAIGLYVCAAAVAAQWRWQ